MAEKGEEKGKLEYAFEFKCADFELKFKGDFNFVQNQLRKYEPKVLVKMGQIVPAEKPQIVPPGGQPHQQTQARPQPQKQPYRDERRRYRDKRRGYRRPQEQYKKEEKKPTREPDFMENTQQVIEEISKPAVLEKKFEIDVASLRSLLERYHPQTLHDRVMIFAFYLEDKALQEFTVSEIQECYQVLAEKAPGNLYTVLNNASRSGFLLKEEKGGKARYRLTFKGKRYVENGLRLD